MQFCIRAFYKPLTIAIYRCKYALRFISYFTIIISGYNCRREPVTTSSTNAQPSMVFGRRRRLCPGTHPNWLRHWSHSKQYRSWSSFVQLGRRLLQSFVDTGAHSSATRTRAQIVGPTCSLRSVVHQRTFAFRPALTRNNRQPPVASVCRERRSRRGSSLRYTARIATVAIRTPVFPPHFM